MYILRIYGRYLYTYTHIDNLYIVLQIPISIMPLLHNEICLRACPWMCVSVNFKFNQNKFNNQFLYFLIYLCYYGIYIYMLTYRYLFAFAPVLFLCCWGAVMRSLHSVWGNLRWCNLYIGCCRCEFSRQYCEIFSRLSLIVGEHFVIAHTDRRSPDAERCTHGLVARVIFNLILRFVVMCVSLVVVFPAIAPTSECVWLRESFSAVK